MGSGGYLYYQRFVLESAVQLSHAVRMACVEKKMIKIAASATALSNVAEQEAVLVEQAFASCPLPPLAFLKLPTDAAANKYARPAEIKQLSAEVEGIGKAPVEYWRARTGSNNVLSPNGVTTPEVWGVMDRVLDELFIDKDFDRKVEWMGAETRGPKVLGDYFWY